MCKSEQHATQASGHAPCVDTSWTHLTQPPRTLGALKQKAYQPWHGSIEEVSDAQPGFPVRNGTRLSMISSR